MNKLKFLAIAVALTLTFGLPSSAQAATTQSACYSFQGAENTTIISPTRALAVFGGSIKKTTSLGTVTVGSFTATVKYNPTTKAITGGNFILTIGNRTITGRIPAGGVLPLVNGEPSGTVSYSFARSAAGYSVTGTFTATVNPTDKTVSGNLCFTLVLGS